MTTSFFKVLLISFSALLVGQQVWANAPRENLVTFNEIKSDYSEFYGAASLTRLSLAYGAGMISAATIDDNIARYYQNNIRNSSTDSFAKTAKNFGEWKYVIPAALAASYLGNRQDGGVGQWGNQTFRALIVGGPGVLVMQPVTGASRPNENAAHGAQWKPFNDNNGVSGHAFVGAVPFLTLANMQAEGSAARYVAVAASLAAPLSRINSNSHYLSQAALGWYMAYEASRAVSTYGRSSAPKAEFLPYLDGTRVGLIYAIPLN
jgi:hypothetical protein